MTVTPSIVPGNNTLYGCATLDDGASDDGVGVDGNSDVGCSDDGVGVTDVDKPLPHEANKKTNNPIHVFFIIFFLL